MRPVTIYITLFILLVFSTGEAEQIAAPALPLKLPNNVAWLNIVLEAKKDGTRRYRRHAFIARGAKFRLETEMFNKPTVVVVFDGTSLGSDIDLQKTKIPEGNSPEFWDARSYVQLAYDSLERSDYKGIEKIDNHNCWLFSDEEEGIKVQLWVDVVKRIPRRLFVLGPGTETIREIYDDLTLPANITPELFDPKNLNVILLGR